MSMMSKVSYVVQEMIDSVEYNKSVLSPCCLSSATILGIKLLTDVHQWKQVHGTISWRPVMSCPCVGYWLNSTTSGGVRWTMSGRRVGSSSRIGWRWRILRVRSSATEDGSRLPRRLIWRGFWIPSILGSNSVFVVRGSWFVVLSPLTRSFTLRN